jgi:molybdopterin molybdotransferase
MITSKEAAAKVLANSVHFGLERIPLAESIGRVLGQEVKADRAFPPFDRVCMDGIAIRYLERRASDHIYKIEAVQAAGHPQLELLDTQNCIEVMTGSVLPKNTDSVIRYEDLEKKEEGFSISTKIKPYSNIHYTGRDIEVGSLIMSPNKVISSTMVGILASVGISEVEVSKLPKIAIIATGDELINVDEIPLPYQIRKSNVIVFKSILNKWNIKSSLFHLPDHQELLYDKLKDILEEFNCLLVSGAVSKGKYDYLPEVMKELGVEKIFHGVKQRPGKPFWFGTKNQTTVFAFPGNPVSSLVCFLNYFRPWLEKCTQSPDLGNSQIVLKEDVDFAPDLTYFAPGILSSEGSQLYAKVSKGNGSGDLINISRIDGFVILPRGRSKFLKGEVFDFIHL